MPYPADLLGKAIQLVYAPKAVAHVPGSLVLSQHSSDLTVPVYTYLPGRPGVAGAPPIPARFTNTNLPWNITFLEYVSGETTTTRLQRPVLTGPFTGCYVFKYIDGGPRVAHVGTDDNGPNSPGSQNAKNNWKGYLIQRGATSVLGAAPDDFYTRGEWQAAITGRNRIPQVYAVIDPGGLSHALLMAPLGPDISPTLRQLYLVKAIKAMQLQPWESIKAMRTFQ